ncbi:hypothetical protein KR222_005715, partial [Zaprionus bogoriensis]
ICLSLLQGTLSAALCLASAVSELEAPTKSSASSYPKKVTTLKKRPTKTPSTAATFATTTKPSKPRVKISKASAATSATAATKTTTATATTKPPASLDASFSNLPADDLEFIKELDKQFKLHGNKIKIKVERDNSTSSAAGGKNNNKRTIDGELGYGYAHQGYDYTPPKFMFYPYSQHDIPATESPDIYTGYSPADYEQPETTQPQHQAPQQVTSVTIEPSYSYELKPQTSYESQSQGAAEQSHAGQPEQPQIDLPQPQQQHETTGAGDDAGGYQEPVIVLRIPGPAKYAAHLQTLLQQYLEIRAAQYLQLLQEVEQRKEQHHQQHQQHQQQQQHVQEEQLAPQAYAAPQQEEQAHYHPEVAYAHQLAPTPPPVQYGPIDDVYHTYKGRQQQQQYEQPALPEAYYTPGAAYQPQPQFYYAQPAQHTIGYENSYQPHVYLIAMAPQTQYADPHAQPEQHVQHVQQPIYVPEQEAPSAPAAESAAHELPITENNPRPTHTKVIFNAAGHGGDYAAPMYALPSIQPYQEEHAEARQAPEQSHVEVAQPADDYQPVQAGHESIGVTQPPYNYHAHGLKMPRQLRQGKRAANAEQAADHQLQQIREYVREKLGAEMGSAVEYKTTQLLEG